MLKQCFPLLSRFLLFSPLFYLIYFAYGPLLCSPPLRYRVTQVELFALLCRLADELLFRQISWIKRLPFFCDLSIEDYTRLLSATWQELILLASLTTTRHCPRVHLSDP